MTKQYDERQQEVIQAEGGYHLVLAAPGCGKTEVLAERIRQAASKGIGFDQMLCLTFTNRAARGMTERIRSMEGIAHEGLDRLYVGNIHRFCSKILFEKEVIPAESAIIDEEDSISILADILGEDELKVCNDNRLRHRYSDIVNLSHFMHQYAGDYPRELIVHAESLDTKTIRAVCDILQRPFTRKAIVGIYHEADELSILKQLCVRDDTRELLLRMSAAQRYVRYKLQHDLIDFEDLLLLVYELPDTLFNNYKWIQVDEIQDLNPLQLAIIDKLTAADNFTVMYLGDSQQAIFSFMGAKLETLSTLTKRCPPQNIHSLYHNYRSPRYLLDVYNEYGNIVLGIERALLPRTDNEQTREPEDLQILMSTNNIDECSDVARLVRQLSNSYAEETTAVIVSYNAEADELSSALKGLGVQHFKVSGQDIFSNPDVKLLLAHLNVVFNEHNFIAWSRLFVGLRAINSHAPARDFVRQLTNVGLSPTDFLLTPEPDSGRNTSFSEFADTCLQQFVACWEQQDIVVYDTETTGLSVFDDDIVQIAAIRLRGGEAVAEPFNVFIETTREIPSMLGDIPNPLIGEYANRPHLSPAEAFRQLLDYADGAVLLAHNASFDYNILDFNLKRRCQRSDLHRLHPVCIDSLKVIRLLRPRLKSHKLKDLLAALHLEGQNSHLADDDIMATVSLVRWCYGQAQALIPRQCEFISQHERVIRKFRAAYKPLYEHTRALLHRRFPADEPPAIVTELAFIYHRLTEEKFVKPVEKLPYLMAYLAEDVIGPGESSLLEQLQNHLTDINTYKESDLCGSSSMRERVFVSTVHKAKGLEFDNVILFDCTDSNYPGFFARQSPSGLDEERRRFYVALSRARRRLFITWSPQKITPWGRVFQTQISPFTIPIQRFFLMRRC